MASGGDWNPQKMLDNYLLDYMRKKNMHETAEIFSKEAGLARDPVGLDSPQGFLYDWWCIFCDTHNSSQTKYQERVQQAIERQEQSMQVQMNQLPNEWDYVNPGIDGMLGQAGPSQLGPQDSGRDQFDQSPGQSDSSSLRIVSSDDLELTNSEAVDPR